MKIASFLKVWLVSLLVTVGGHGCGPSLQQVTPETTFRLIDAEPNQLVTPRQLYLTGILAVWDFGSDEDRSRWKIRDMALIGVDSIGAAYRSLSDDPKMIGDVEFDADLIDSVEVEIFGDVGRDIRFFWAGKGETFVRDRSVAWKGPYSESTVHFQLGDHPMWKGKISRFRIDPTSTDGIDFTIGDVRVLKPLEEASLVSQNRPQVFKVDLDGDARNAIAIAAGDQVTHRVILPERARLRSSLASIRADSKQFDCTIVVTQGGRECRVFVERIGGIGSPDVLGWQDREVTLDGCMPGAADLTLSVEPTGSDESDSSIVLWGNPEIFGPPQKGVGPNVLLISIDTLRAVSMSAYGYPRNTTPFLEEWASGDAAVFNNVIATSPWTKPSHASMLTGLGSLTHDVNFDAPVPQAFELLSETFRHAGYRTFAVTGGVYVRPDEGFAQGFDTFQYWNSADNEGELRAGTAQLLRQLDLARRSGRPFFGFFHTYEVHSPYRARQPYYSRFTGGLGETSGGSPEFTTRKNGPIEADGFKVGHRVVEKVARGTAVDQVTPIDGLSRVVAAYDSSVALVDDNLRMLIDYLVQNDLYDNTIIVVTADHGEALGEHGEFGHTGLFDEVLKVPLIVYAPGRDFGGARIDSQISLEDVSPTLLDLCRIDGPDDADGRSLVGLLEGRQSSGPRNAWSYAGSTNKGVSLRADNHFKLIFPYSVWNAEMTSKPAVFDLEGDPTETSSVAPDEPALRDLAGDMGKRLLNRRSGIRISVTNSKETKFEFSLKGVDVRVNSLKSPNLACDCAQWMGPKGAVFTVPPGESFEVIVDGYTGSEISCVLTGPTDDSIAQHINLSPTEMSPELNLWWTGTEWAFTDKGAGSGTIFRAVLESMSSLAGSETDTDGRLEEQLRALGYLEVSSETPQ